MAQNVKNLPAVQETWFDPWIGKIPWRRERPPTPVFWPGEFHGLYSLRGRKESDMTEQFSPYQPGFPGGSMVKNLSTNAGDMGSVPGSGISPGEGNGNPLHCSSLGNPRQKSLVGYSPCCHKRLRHDLARKQQKEQCYPLLISLDPSDTTREGPSLHSLPHH